MAEVELCHCGQPKKKYYWMHYFLLIALLPVGLVSLGFPLKRCRNCGLAYALTRAREEDIEAAIAEDRRQWWRGSVMDVIRRLSAGLLRSSHFRFYFLVPARVPLLCILRAPGGFLKRLTLTRWDFFSLLSWQTKSST